MKSRLDRMQSVLAVQVPYLTEMAEAAYRADVLAVIVTGLFAGAVPPGSETGTAVPPALPLPWTFVTAVRAPEHTAAPQPWSQAFSDFGYLQPWTLSQVGEPV
jgi:hypothetical protein